MKKSFNLLLAALILFVSFAWAAPAQAAEPVVRAVMFYSPTCGHCHKVINDVLPPILEKYQEQFELLAIDVSNMSGSALYQATAKHFSLPDERMGVPALVIGDIILVGSAEIPDELPGLIERGLAAGGLDWPPVPELLAAIQLYQQSLAQTQPAASTGDATPVPVGSPVQTGENIGTTSYAFSVEGMLAAFQNDPLANTVAVIVLAAMLISMVAAGLRYLNGPAEPAAWLSARWIIPVLSLIGLGVALYLSYGEVFGGSVVCGPVGKCESVQESQYAKLFGFLHVGILGVIGYIGILFAWALSQFGPRGLRVPATISVWGMAWFGVLFSVYLTFLEPFVIGATCMWCITSAVLMTMILWVSNEQARMVLIDKEEDDFEEDLVQA